MFTVGSAACALAPSVPLLVAFRAFQAVGAALVMPTSLALLLAAFPPVRRAMAVSVWAAVGGAAAALGPPLGGVLAHLSWRWVFLVNVPVGVLALVVGPRVLRESREAGSGMPDLVGAVGSAAGIGALTWALVSAPDHGWDSRPVLIGFGVAVICLVAVVLRSVRHPVPLLDLASLRVLTLWLSCLAMLLFATAFGSMLDRGRSYRWATTRRPRAGKPVPQHEEATTTVFRDERGADAFRLRPRPRGDLPGCWRQGGQLEALVPPAIPLADERFAEHLIAMKENEQ